MLGIDCEVPVFSCGHVCVPQSELVCRRLRGLGHKEALYLFIDLLRLDNRTIVVRKFLTIDDRVK